jgi:hypothetical protein
VTLSRTANDGKSSRVDLLDRFWSCAAWRRSEGNINMKYLFAAVLVAATVAGVGGASAAGGCGPGWHPNPYGECRPNRGPAVVVEPGAVVVERPVVVVPGRGCPLGFVWRYGRCRPI